MTGARWLLIGAGAVIVVGTLGYCYAHRGHEPTEPPSVTLARSDSLQATLAQARAERDSIRAEAERWQADAAKHQDQIKPTRSFIHVIDSVLVSRPLPPDSDAAGWKERAGLEKTRGDSLQKIVTHQDSTILDLGQSVARYVRLDSISTKRIDALEDNNQKLTSDLRDALRKRVRFGPCASVTAGINPKKEGDAVAGLGFCLSRS